MSTGERQWVEGGRWKMSGGRVDDDDDDDEVCACWYRDTAKESKRAGSSTRYWCVRGERRGGIVSVIIYGEF